MKDILKAIRTFLRKIQLTITFKTPLIDFSFALLLIQLLLIGSFSTIIVDFPDGWILGNRSVNMLIVFPAISKNINASSICILELR